MKYFFFYDFLYTDYRIVCFVRKQCVSYALFIYNYRVSNYQSAEDEHRRHRANKQQRESRSTHQK